MKNNLEKGVSRFVVAALLFVSAIAQAADPHFYAGIGFDVGLTHHRNVQAECDLGGGLCPFSKVDLDNSTGLLIEYLYRVRREDSNKGFSVGIRLGAIEYQEPGGIDDVSGGFIGANLGITL